MNFSKVFLDKLLKSAVFFHNNQEECNELPNKFISLDDAISKLESVIKFEANKALRNEILVDSPILHAVNLDTKYPGIILEKIDKKVIVHKKEKLPKTEEQLLKELENQLKNKEIREKNKEEKQKIKEKEKLEKQDLKEENNIIKLIEKNLIKNSKNIEKKTKTKDKLDTKITKNNNVDEDDNKMFDLLDKELISLNEENKIMEDEYESRNQKIQEKNNILNELKEQKLKEKNDKIKNKQEKKEKTEEKKKIKKDKKEKQIAEEEKQYMEQLFNLQNEKLNENIEDEINENNENDVNNNSQLDSGEIKIYESPLPFQRHLESLEYAELNNNLMETILNGMEPKNGYSLTIYHGPPGTGKTYKLIETLTKLIKDNKKYNYLVCAPSNIGVLNLYDRAKSFNIYGNLILAKNNILNEQEIKNSNIYFSTVSMRYSNIMKNLKFHVILMDEAAQCQESWTWGLFRNELKHIYLAGDQHQLPAIVSEEGNKLNHSRSLMARLTDLGYPTNLLNIQRRMHPEIVKFSNKTFYDNKLKTDYKGSDIDKKPFEIIDIKGDEERIGTSYQNMIEAKKVIEVVKDLNIENTIIISPYNAQCKLLKSLDDKLEIHTVDSFQGREADAIILTIVRSGDKIGFWNDYRRLNVGLTRARHVLRIVGNVETMIKQEGPLKLLANEMV